MEKLRSLIPIALSLFIALGGSYFIYRYIQKQKQPAEIVEVKTRAVPVVVAAANLPLGSKIKPEMLKKVSYLEESIPTGHFSDFEEINGRVLINNLKANDPVTEHRLAPITIKTGGVAAILKPGTRAVGIKGDKVIGISGLINPGNYVDVLVTVEDPEKKEEKTKTILERIQVLATGTEIQKNEKGEPMPIDVYTLEVTADEAEKLALAASEGRIQLALRSVIDSDDVLTDGITVPQLLASYSHPKVKPIDKEDSKKKSVVSKKKRVRRWKSRKTFSVEIIKGIKVSKRKFSE
jgi:pilus assembly protein CpaB